MTRPDSAPDGQAIFFNDLDEVGAVNQRGVEFDRGALVLRPGLWRALDVTRLLEHTLRSARVGAAIAAVSLSARG